jgi:poly(3-hydroxybutyrate) depolymerase
MIRSCGRLGATAALLAALAAIAVPSAGSVASSPSFAPGFHQVTFPSDGRMLVGYLWIPKSAAGLPAKTYPVVVWNHGSNETVLRGQGKYLSGFYNDSGFIFFIPVRRGHDPSPGPYRSNLDGLFAEADDVTAAIDWLKGLRQVDPKRFVVTGGSNGGIMALVEADKRIDGLRASIPFATGAESWQNNLGLRFRLVTAAAAVKIPVFMIQAQNDYDLGPGHVLGPIITSNSIRPHRAKIYPPYGTTNQEGHATFVSKGYTVWGADVLKFIRRAFAQPAEQG